MARASNAPRSRLMRFLFCEKQSTPNNSGNVFLFLLMRRAPSKRRVRRVPYKVAAKKWAWKMTVGAETRQVKLDSWTTFPRRRRRHRLYIARAYILFNITNSLKKLPHTRILWEEKLWQSFLLELKYLHASSAWEMHSNLLEMQLFNYIQYNGIFYPCPFSARHFFFFISVKCQFQLRGNIFSSKWNVAWWNFCEIFQYNRIQGIFAYDSWPKWAWKMTCLITILLKKISFWKASEIGFSWNRIHI